MSWLGRKLGPEGVPLAAALVILLAGCLIGGGLVKASQKDYSSYTGRTTAVVSDVVDHDDRESYYVDYEAEGETFEHQSLSGSWSGDPEVGDKFVLAYPPGSPEDSVTESRLDPSTGRIMLGIGLGLIALVLLIFGLILFRFLYRTGRVGPGSKHPARGVASVVAPADPSTLPQPWPWEQVIAHLVAASVATPYHVFAEGNQVEVSLDIADAQWATALRQHGLTSGFTVRLRPHRGGPRFVQTDTIHDIEWSAGTGRFVGRGRTQTGWVWSRRRRVEYGIGADGSFGKQLDVNFNSSDVKQWIHQVVEPSGWRSRLGAEARGALVFAVLGGGGAIVALVVLAVTGKFG